jgi:Chromo (CHRromatin Organisation MOdifier) domain
MSMKRLHPVFNIVKLTLTAPDPIAGRQVPPPPPPELIDSKNKYLVEEIKDSRMFHRQLQYLVKWAGYGPEENSCEYAENVQ